MLSPHRRDPATGDVFTFFNPNLSDPDPSKNTEYERWAERIKGKYNYFGRLEDVKYGAWTRRTTKNESDTPSPELWQSERPPVRSAGSSPVRNSPARYRQEMLELVKDVPETVYELSLIDMVESTRITRADDTSKKKKKKKGMKRAKSASRTSESMETGGLMLKMFTPRAPPGLGCRRQSFGVNSGTCAKVSQTRPGAADGEKGGAERRRKEWWSSNSSGASSSNSSGSTNSSSSSSSSISSRIIGSCYPFITHKGKSMERED